MDDNTELTQHKKTRWVNMLIKKLLNFHRSQSHVDLTEQDILFVLSQVYPLIKQEPNLLKLSAPIYICGDIHGQYADLLQLLKLGELPPKSKYLFLGDYVDRGDNSIEVILLLFCLKIRFPKHMYMIRGNHECENVNRIYGFYDECLRKFGSLNVWKYCTEVFDFLPLAGLIEGKLFCVHGGLSPSLKTFDDVKFKFQKNAFFVNIFYFYKDQIN